GIPVIAVVDTNCDPTYITYPIPGNDDAIRAISLFVEIIANAVIDADNEAGIQIIESLGDDEPIEEPEVSKKDDDDDDESIVYSTDDDADYSKFENKEEEDDDRADEDDDEDETLYND
ncbi:MAG TPA: 30S ribosomal protein S2, partial [Sphaerochaeta sp.]|nr:30S ribosomal protein S2 [Sphaerochaeta sp.]